MKKTAKQPLKRRLFLALFSLFFACSALFSFLPTTPVYADPKPTTTETTSNSETKNPKTTENPSESEKTEEKTEENKFTDEDLENVCNNQSGALGWLICPSSGAISKAVDSIYATIEDFLVINPIPADSSSTIHIVWDYVKGFTNIVFIIFLLVVVISHLTGFGLANYGWKRILPRLIIVGILVNLSFIICQIAVDISNLLGYGLRDLFLSVEENAIMSGAIRNVTVTWADLVNVVTGAATAAGIGIALSGGLIAVFWTLVPVLLGAIVSIAIGFITIAMRQALVAVLVMISPLAFVCFLLPNTEKWFTKWKDTLFKMLIFYPAFSFLFGASHLAGWAIITSSVNENGETSGFGVLLGLAVQVFPLFFSWSLMKMSGTILGTVNQKLHGLAAKPLSAVSRISESNRDYARRKYYANSHGVGATAHKYMDYRKQLRETDAANLKSIYDTDIQSRINRKLQSGYSPNNPEKNDLKANTYLRNAKRASISKMKADTSTKDVAHVLDKYGDYYGRLSPKDAALGNESAKTWLEYNRASFTTVADEEADFDYLVDQYISMNELGRGNIKYQRYINSVSPNGRFSVMGQLINKAAAVETRRRRDYSIMLAKWNFDKRNFRNMAVGYLTDDNGLAVDENGEAIEKQPGYWLSHDPTRLIAYDTVDEDGRAYFDWMDQGKFVMRVYRDDSAFMKEAFANYDTVINDPMNALYAILSGIKPGSVLPNNPNYKHIGLDKYSTTLGRAIQASNYKEKNAAFSPYLNEMIKKRYVKTTGQLNIAMLDSLLKGAKAGNFVTQDQFSIKQYAYLLDPDNFSIAFPDSDIMSYVNINGDGLKGYDENGNEVAAEAASVEQKKRYLQQKYILKSMNMMLQMMTKYTPSIGENQKTSAAEALEKLKATIDKWRNLSDENSPLLAPVTGANPYKKSSSSSYQKMARIITEELDRTNPDLPTPNEDDPIIDIPLNTLNHMIDQARDAANDGQEFFDSIASSFAGRRGLDAALDLLQDYLHGHFNATKDELYNELLSILSYLGITF